MGSPYVLPNFNLQAAIWYAYDRAVSAYAGYDNRLLCNLTPGRRVMTTFNGVQWIHPNGVSMLPNPMEVLLEKGTTVSPMYDVVGNNCDLMEIPFGSTRFYLVICVDDIGKGFANEHRFAFINMVNQAVVFTDVTWPFPVPLP